MNPISLYLDYLGLVATLPIELYYVAISVLGVFNIGILAAYLGEYISDGYLDGTARKILLFSLTGAPFWVPIVIVYCAPFIAISAAVYLIVLLWEER